MLRQAGVAGPNRRVLEIGAGSGQATRDLVRGGSDVVALEPGANLAALLRQAVPNADIRVTTLEDARLAPESFAPAVAATVMYWIDLDVGLPNLHAALRKEGGWRCGETSSETTPSRPSSANV